jgi:threonine dehydrogenase-like Zn-dependent dehydrogenase
VHGNNLAAMSKATFHPIRKEVSSAPLQMRALVLTDHGAAVIDNYPVPVPPSGEALLRLRVAGICATDIEMTRGYKGRFRGVLGHEFVADVVAASAAPEWVGRRVVGEINVGCGHCRLCTGGLGKHCVHRTSLGIIGRNGAFSEYFTLPIANLHEVPAHLADEQAVFVEPLAAALEILEQVRLGPTQRVYLVGDGRLGLLIALVLASTKCRLTVIGRHAEKLAWIASVTGAATLLAGSDEVAALANEPADVVVEVTGSGAGFSTALALVRPMGTLVLKSTFAGTLDGFNISDLVVREITVIGSRCGPFDKALAFLPAVDLVPMVHDRFRLTDGVQALERATAKGVLKVLLTP